MIVTITLTYLNGHADIIIVYQLNYFLEIIIYILSIIIAIVTI